MTTSDDVWDAFGSDDDNSLSSHHRESGEPSPSAVGLDVANFLSQAFLKADPNIRLSERHVLVYDDEEEHVSRILLQRGFTVKVYRSDAEAEETAGQLVDALVLYGESSEESVFTRLVVGGILVCREQSICDPNQFTHPSPLQQSGNNVSLYQCVRQPSHHPIHHSRCSWLENHSIESEKRLIQCATRCLSRHEIRTGNMTETSIQKSVKILRESGYCIIRGLLNPQECKAWGDAVLGSLHSAAKILLERDEVDIYQPHTSKYEPQAYRELSMREDLRFDIRQGPQLSAYRAGEADGDVPVIVKGETPSFGGFLRGNESLLEIIRRTMNPKTDELYKGNLGRFNFGGSGNNGSFQDLRLSPVGGIVTLPGCADQAIHADTAHLFESHADLPAHYLNVFTPGTAFNPKVGGTAFVHGSHNLEFTAKHCGSRNDYKAAFPFLVRPSLDLGDVVIFDCRILHFGMSNDPGSGSERAMLYTNTTMTWFTDPKNWDDKKRIFEDN